MAGTGVTDVDVVEAPVVSRPSLDDLRAAGLGDAVGADIYGRRPHLARMPSLGIREVMPAPWRARERRASEHEHAPTYTRRTTLSFDPGQRLEGAW